MARRPLDLPALYLKILLDQADDALVRAFEAQKLFDRTLNRLRLVPQPLELLRVLEQGKQAAANQRGRRLMSADEKRHAG